MNISSGISEIGYINNAGKAAKVYIWPNYNAGKIEPVRTIPSEKNDQYIYRKADEKTEKNIMKQFDNLSAATYNGNGRILRNAGSTISPGALFNALA
jgi:hypothetical protein